MINLINKRLRNGIIIFGSMIFSLLGCNSSKVTVIDDMVCNPPCWQNIVPGISSEQDALDIIKSLPNVDRESIKYRASSNQLFDREIVFEFGPDDSVGIIEILSEKVVIIYFYNNLNLTLDRAFHSLGEPTYLINLITQADYGHGYGEENYLNAINHELGISIDFFTGDQSFWNRGKIQPSIKINSITFFDANSFEMLANDGFFTLGNPIESANRNILNPWIGYGDLEENYPAYKFYKK